MVRRGDGRRRVKGVCAFGLWRDVPCVNTKQRWGPAANIVSGRCRHRVLALYGGLGNEARVWARRVCKVSCELVDGGCMANRGHHHGDGGEPDTMLARGGYKRRVRASCAVDRLAERVRERHGLAKSRS